MTEKCEASPRLKMKQVCRVDARGVYHIKVLPDYPRHLPGCITFYGHPTFPNGPCDLCNFEKLCKENSGGQ
jgi:hypothetical protein